MRPKKSAAGKKIGADIKSPADHLNLEIKILKKSGEKSLPPKRAVKRVSDNKSKIWTILKPSVLSLCQKKKVERKRTIIVIMTTQPFYHLGHLFKHRGDGLLQAVPIDNNLDALPHLVF